MSSILKSDILGAGSLEQEIFAALNDNFGCSSYSDSAPQDPCAAQQKYAARLANAIAEGVARGVQAYLKKTVTISTGGPLIHTHLIDPK